MKDLQQNLFVVVAVSLCALCVYQWYGQTLQRNEIQHLEQSVYEKAAAIQGYTNSIRTMDQQIAQMDARLTELKLQARTNADLIIDQKREINRLQITSQGLNDRSPSTKRPSQIFSESLKRPMTESKNRTKPLRN